MINMKICGRNQDGDEILGVIIDTSCASYTLSSIAMLFILVLIVCKRGHWAAIGLTLAYTLAFGLKGLAYSGLVDVGG